MRRAADRSRVLARNALPIETVALARYLVGKMLVREMPDGPVSGRIGRALNRIDPCREGALWLAQDNDAQAGIATGARIGRVAGGGSFAALLRSGERLRQWSEGIERTGRSLHLRRERSCEATVKGPPSA